MLPRFETLPNGLRVVLAPCEAESVAFGIFVESGSRHEPAKFAGISHFIEHMLFKGTPSRKPLDITRAIEGRGGNFNACTSEESTCFFAHLPSEYLVDAIEILADMYINASVPNDEFEREKQVVIEEIKMYADEPSAVAGENLQRALFPKSRLGLPVAGTAATLRPLVSADLRDYIHTHYVAPRTVAVVVGQFDPDCALKEIARRFEKCPRRGVRLPGKDVDFTLRPVTKVSVDKDIHQLQLALGYRLFGIGDRRRYVVTMLDAILGRGMSSRLFQEVREKRGLSYDISTHVNLFSDAGMFSISAGLDSARLDEAMKIIDRELERIRTIKVSAAELKRVKEFLIGNFRLSHERVTSKMFSYGGSVLAFGRPLSVAEQVDGIRAVTSADVLATAKAILRPSARSLSVVVPKHAV